MACTLTNKAGSAQSRSSLSLDSDLKNPVEVTRGGRLEQARIMWDFFFNKSADTRPAGNIPVQPLTGAQLLAAPDNGVIISHDHYDYLDRPNTGCYPWYAAIPAVSSSYLV